MLSTPAAITTSMLPAITACAAKCSACCDEPHCRSIDVAGTLKAKLGVDRAPLKILGACNPGFAHRSLELDPSSSLLLPCNVVLESTADGGTRVSAVDPRALMPDEAFAELAAEAADGLKGAIDAVGA